MDRRRPRSAPGKQPKLVKGERRGANIDALLKRCEERLGEFPLPTPFDVNVLSRVLAAQRGRPIKLLPLPRLGPLMGTWIPTLDVDIVVYPSDTTHLHQDHVILHELCHIWCGHKPISVSPADLAAVMRGDLNVVGVHHLWRRATYSSEEDREAEVLASLILQRVGMADWSKPKPMPAGDAEVLEHLAAILGSSGTRRT